MKISIITLFPKMVASFFEESIVKRAIENNLAKIGIVNLREFAVDKYGSVDDRPYGGGAGMVLRADVIYKTLQSMGSVISNEVRDPGRRPQNASLDFSPDIRRDRNNNRKKQKIILTSPKGKIFNQSKAVEYSKLDHLVIIAGHYEDADARVLDFVDEEISMGDFVMTGGEITAAAITDSVVRLLPQVLKKEEAIQYESFMTTSINRLIEVLGEDEYLKNLKEKGIKTVKLLEYPQYTRPEEFMRKKVPEVLLSGNHKEIEKWRLKKAYEETLKKRPDLFKI